MKFVLAFAALIAVAAAIPIGPTSEGDAVILKDIRVNDNINGYQFAFDTSNGISQEETGVLKQVGEVPVIVVDGIASWTSPEGLKVTLKYSADEEGYKPILPIA